MIPTPPVFRAGLTPSAMIVVWGALALGAFGYAAFLAVRDRDVLPVAACVGALICALNEPIYDILAKLVYAQVPASYTAYTAFGRRIPWTLVVGYLPWVGLVPYLLARRMAGGISRSRLHLIALGLMVSVGLVELVNALWLHDWRYYGGHAARGVLGGGIIQMGAMPLLCAFLLYAFAGGASGLRRVVLGIVIPTMALPMVFAATTWPLYVANYASIPEWLHWAAAALAVAFCASAVLGITSLVERWQARDAANPVPLGPVAVDGRRAPVASSRPVVSRALGDTL